MTTIWDVCERIKALPHVKNVEYWRDSVDTPSGNGYHVELEDDYNYEGCSFFIEQTYKDVLKSIKLIRPDKL